MNALDRLRLLRDTLPAQGSVTFTREALSELLGEVEPVSYAYDKAPGDLTVEMVGAELKRHPNTVRDWIRAGDLKAYLFGKEYRVTRANLDAFLEAKRAGKREIAGTPGMRADLGRWRKVRKVA